ncbi:MAG: PEP-CTERM sorting domain-containing protein [Planctomycetales bacterium]
MGQTIFPNVITQGVQGVELNSTPFVPVPVPEPSTFLLLGSVALGAGFLRLRRKQAA